MDCIQEEYERLTKRKWNLKLLQQEQPKWNLWVKRYDDDMDFHCGTDSALFKISRLAIFSKSLRFEYLILLQYVSALEKELVKCKGKKKKEIKKSEEYCKS